METNRLLSPDEVATALGVSKQTLAVWRCEQRYPLQYIKVGSRVRYRDADVQQFIHRMAQPGEAVGTPRMSS